MKFGLKPSRNTVELIARQLGVISDLQMVEAILHNKDRTIGFDATTQEGCHINSVYVTTMSSCYVIAVDELTGGTAADYTLAQHIRPSDKRPFSIHRE